MLSQGILLEKFDFLMSLLIARKNLLQPNKTLENIQPILRDHLIIILNLMCLAVYF